MSSEMQQQPSSTAALVPSSSSTKRLSTINKPNTSSPAKGGNAGNVAGVGGKDVVSPGELCGFVDTLLAQLETRFDEMSDQVLARMNEMSHRIDNLENAIENLMQDDLHENVISPAPQK
ncbi:hypothetical protein I302_104275 [Kwoniella bestiolae CBS 10118]|uniref:Heat shock factor-binding protein 1 n=1 Tax=Kwoniella bestiolae CBS 10118 TaxID=1296100 RepID=A0A1B9GAT1_9TREE|nr:hypothetical protein I302_02983 [Kwoniella bestiolae CBS 10118]OCF28132.1 hypothetical protein I302_02983 [Kwoniella bestiolae CBS 10118]